MSAASEYVIKVDLICERVAKILLLSSQNFLILSDGKLTKIRKVLLTLFRVVFRLFKESY